MAKNIKKIAEILGAKIVDQVPATGGGMIGVSHLAAIVAQVRELRERSKKDRSNLALDIQFQRRSNRSRITSRKGLQETFGPAKSRPHSSE